MSGSSIQDQECLWDGRGHCWEWDSLSNSNFLMEQFNILLYPIIRLLDPPPITFFLCTSKWHHIGDVAWQHFDFWAKLWFEGNFMIEFWPKNQSVAMLMSLSHDVSTLWGSTLLPESPSPSLASAMIRPGNPNLLPQVSCNLVALSTTEPLNLWKEVKLLWKLSILASSVLYIASTRGKQTGWQKEKRSKSPPSILLLL